MRIEDKIILMAVVLFIIASVFYMATRTSEITYWVFLGILCVPLIISIRLVLTSTKEDAERKAYIAFTDMHPAKSVGRWIPVILLIILVVVFIWVLLHIASPILGQ